MKSIARPREKYKHDEWQSLLKTKRNMINDSKDDKWKQILKKERNPGGKKTTKQVHLEGINSPEKHPQPGEHLHMQPENEKPRYSC